MRIGVMRLGVMERMFVAWALLALGCNGEGPDGKGTDPSTTSEPTTEPTGTTVDAPTFADDVLPLVASSCGQCHGPSGLGPLDLLDYDVASTWAEVLLDRIDAGEMPPPTADPDCHPYQGMDETRLDPALGDTLARWIETGLQPGDLDSAPPVEIWSPPALSRRDVELRPPAGVSPQFVEGNEYRCFLVDDIEEDTWVSGLEFLIDHPQISHHAVLFVDPNGGSEQRITDAASRSWTCPSVQPEPNWEMIHAWAPSGGAVEFPEGMGLRVPAGSQIVLQMHYWEGADGIVDLPGYALKLSDAVDREMYYAPVGPDRFTIPAGEASHSETMSLPMFLLGGGAWEVFGVMPHMHVLGTGYDFRGTTSGGADKCISRSDAYDFALQPTYWFDEPVRLEASDRIEVTCTWDNSASNPRQLNDPPQDVTWGEYTQQEMCYALMYIAQAQ
ncbi:MAG: hypothetical protein R3F59_37925 [Myxococcota bacterium]